MIYFFSAWLLCFRCPIDPQIISRFEVNADRTQATAILKSMFKFPEGKKIARIQVIGLRMTAIVIIIIIIIVYIFCRLRSSFTM